LIDPGPVAARDPTDRGIREVNVKQADRSNDPRALAGVRSEIFSCKGVNVRKFGGPIPCDQAGFEDFIGRRNGKKTQGQCQERTHKGKPVDDVEALYVRTGIISRRK
jgi:hypothetical protein